MMSLPSKLGPVKMLTNVSFFWIDCWIRDKNNPSEASGHMHSASCYARFMGLSAAVLVIEHCSRCGGLVAAFFQYAMHVASSRNNNKHTGDNKAPVNQATIVGV